MKTYAEMAAKVGPGLYKAGLGKYLIAFPVDVVDVRESFGNVQLLIRARDLPDNGEAWVDESAVIVGGHKDNEPLS